eukprot:TRINITY_DN6949_c0_g2_i2.p1 TRINITY_DN6949_c0_g2~~TRINITY_DN6949_c0_g2_i2.p1  ORF type:complete len:374 (+),score=73.47 TRINITY_DN6949_c0_g2_i2:152-1273(+)
MCIRDRMTNMYEVASEDAKRCKQILADRDQERDALKHQIRGLEAQNELLEQLLAERVRPVALGRHTELAAAECRAADAESAVAKMQLLTCVECDALKAQAKRAQERADENEQRVVRLFSELDRRLFEEPCADGDPSPRSTRSGSSAGFPSPIREQLQNEVSVLTGQLLETRSQLETQTKVELGLRVKLGEAEARRLQAEAHEVAARSDTDHMEKAVEESVGKLIAAETRVIELEAELKPVHAQNTTLRAALSQKTEELAKSKAPQSPRKEPLAAGEEAVLSELLEDKDRLVAELRMRLEAAEATVSRLRGNSESDDAGDIEFTPLRQNRIDMTASTQVGSVSGSSESGGQNGKFIGEDVKSTSARAATTHVQI